MRREFRFRIFCLALSFIYIIMIIEPTSETFPPDLLKKYINPVFIETGVRGSNLSAYALCIDFEKSHAIDPDPESISRIQLNYPQVNSYLGKSEDILPNILLYESRPITYWLDGHLDSGPPELQYTPLPQELIAIAKSHGLAGSVIMIDDIRMIEKGSGWGHMYRLNQLMEDIAKLFIRRVEIEYVDSKHCKKDIMILRIL